MRIVFRDMQLLLVKMLQRLFQILYLENTINFSSGKIHLRYRLSKIPIEVKFRRTLRHLEKQSEGI